MIKSSLYSLYNITSCVRPGPDRDAFRLYTLAARFGWSCLVLIRSGRLSPRIWIVSSRCRSCLVGFRGTGFGLCRLGCVLGGLLSTRRINRLICGENWIKGYKRSYNILKSEFLNNYFILCYFIINFILHLENNYDYSHSKGIIVFF